MNLKYHQKVLADMVEKILFNETDLQILKTLINEVSSGRTDPKQLKVTILNSRANMLQRITSIFPFYTKRIEDAKEIEQFSGNGTNAKLKKELDEKNALLQLLGEKIGMIERKLQKT
ncbi:MAG: hypothetical protein ACFE8N_03475 [Promethearchaeota archaeon]